MKRFVLGKLFIISAALIVLSFISCNQNLKEENGMGKVVISLGNTARNVNTEGLPILDEHNTTIRINVAGESEQYHHHHYYGSKISVEFPIGTEITVTANVETAAKICWWGKKTLTVAAGVNNVSLELSKTPFSVPSVGFSLSKKENTDTFSIEIGSNGSNGSDEIERDLTVSKDFTPKIKRDGIGRVYVLYKDKDDSKKYLTRYTVEGEADTAFKKAVSELSGQNQNFMNNIENIAVDTETGNIFLIEKEGILPAGFRIYCIIKEAEKKEAEKFKCYSGNLSGVKVKAAAAYNGTLFLAGIKDNDTKLLAYRLKTENNMLELTPAGETGIKNISPERQRGKTDCNDIHADGTGVYVLLSSTSLKGNIYSVGQINSYEYDYNNGSFGTNVKRAGRTTKQLENGGIASDEGYSRCFSKPVAFTGWGNDYLYIADDGINIVYKEASENLRVDGNKNRTAFFNKKSNDLSFDDFGITWYEEYPDYTPPNTPVLSWEKDFNTTPTFYGMRYWTSADGTKAFSDENKLWKESTVSTIKPTDIFCYDQDGNLYIFYKDSNYNKVRRFELNDGSYVSTNESFATLDNEPTAIAVDISNGKNCLYYAYEDGNAYFIKKYEWGDKISNEIQNNFAIEIKGEQSSLKIDITALAANKDGLFAAIKNVDIGNEYTLTVKKYEKDGNATCEVFTHETADSHGTTLPYNSYTGAINALQIRNNILYGIMSEVTQHNTYGGTPPKYSVDGFKNGSRLYGFGRTDESLSKSELITKSYKDKVGYGFYRFIAVQENKLVIASDGAWGILSPECINNIDKVFIYNTTSKAFEEEDGNKSYAKYTLHVVKE